MNAPVVSGGEARRDDLLLAARCASRPPCREAWSKLWGEYAAGVRAWIRQGYRLGGDEGVDDLAQSVFVLCAQGALARYRGDVALKSYLYLIADRVRISENRRLSRQRRDVRRRVSMDAPVGQDGETNLASLLTKTDSMPHNLGMWMSDYGERPDQSFARSSLAAEAHQHLAKLKDPTDREIVRLYFWEGSSDREIGQTTALPTNTVTWRRHRALAELRRSLKRSRMHARFSVLVSSATGSQS